MKSWTLTERLHFHFSVSCIGEGNGNPLQCSCLEHPKDGGAWWAAVCWVAQSRTWLNRLSSSNYLGLRHMNHRLTLYLSFPLFRLVSGNLGRWVWAHTLRVYKIFTKTGRGPWLRGARWARWCNKLYFTICIILLSEFVSQNAWLQPEDNKVGEISRKKEFPSPN